MQKQTKPEPLGSPMAKLVLVVAIIVSFSVILGALGYVLTKQKPVVQNLPIIEKADETVDWQTYRNEEYGFEFKYPKELLMLIVSPLEARSIERTTGDNKKYSGLDLGEFNNGCNLSLFITDTGENINPFDETGFPEKAKEVVATKKIEFDKKTYHLGISVASHAVDTEECNSFFDQILSTFKFTEK